MVMPIATKDDVRRFWRLIELGTKSWAKCLNPVKRANGQPASLPKPYHAAAFDPKQVSMKATPQPPLNLGQRAFRLWVKVPLSHLRRVPKKQAWVEKQWTERGRSDEIKLSRRGAHSPSLSNHRKTPVAGELGGWSADCDVHLLRIVVAEVGALARREAQAQGERLTEATVVPESFVGLKGSEMYWKRVASQVFKVNNPRVRWRWSAASVPG